jgi:hypothetical protein
MKLPLLLFVFVASTAFGQPQLATNAPIDKPVAVMTNPQFSALERAIAPHVAKARETYPEAKRRYLAGLPPKHVFFVTTRLRDMSGVLEQVFIAVERINDGKITGTISSNLALVKDYKRGQRYTLAETDLLDWLISKPDGTEEGNFVGKFLDTYKP